MYYLMLARLFVIPLLLLAGAAILALLLPWFADQLQTSAIVSQASLTVRNWTPYVIGAFLAASVITAAVQGWELWQWRRGDREICHRCGGMVEHKSGRYGPYWRCLACDKNSSIR